MSKTPVQAFAEAIRQLRKNRNLSRKEFAKRCHCSPNSVRCWEEETAAPSLDHIWSISKGLNIPFDVVLGRDNTDDVILLDGLTFEEKDCIRRIVQTFRNQHK